MRKRVKGRTFSRKPAVRNALLRSLARALIMHERIQTTEAKAKEVRSFVEPLITTAKQNNLAAQRRVARYLDGDARKRVFDEYAPRYEQRKGGYTRIRKMGQRVSDGAPMVIMEFVK